MAISNDEIVQRLQKHFPGEQGRILARIYQDIAAQAAAETAAIRTWSNALAAKLNADAGVSDTDYTGVP